MKTRDCVSFDELKYHEMYHEDELLGLILLLLLFEYRHAFMIKYCLSTLHTFQ